MFRIAPFQIKIVIENSMTQGKSLLKEKFSLRRKMSLRGDLMGEIIFEEYHVEWDDNKNEINMDNSQ